MSDIDVSNDNTRASGEGDKTVSYESHQKLLGQRKADQTRIREMQERLDAIEVEKKKAEENSLLEQNKYKEAYENLTKEHETLKDNFGNLSNSIVRAEKLSAFEKAAGATLKNEAFAQHIDFDSIMMNDSGEIDENSLNHAVGNFKNTFGESLLNINSSKKLPSGEPSNVTNGAKPLEKMTAEEIRAEIQKLGQ